MEENSKTKVKRFILHKKLWPLLDAVRKLYPMTRRGLIVEVALERGLTALVIEHPDYKKNVGGISETETK